MKKLNAFQSTIALAAAAVAVIALVVAALIHYPDNRIVHAQLAGSAGFKYTPITTATNTQVASAGGTLHNIVINGGTLGTLTIVDTSAANCTGGTTIGTTATVVAGQVYVYDLQYNNGLCITTSAATNLTVMAR